MDKQQHWQSVYATKDAAHTSWFRPHLDESLRLIDALDLPKDAPIIDVGGGRATLVDDLLARGFGDVSVLDLSAAALADARARLGARGEAVRWLTADATTAVLPPAHYGLWHDRAVFHFLIDADDRARYVANTARSVRPHGHVIVGCFAPDGPERCSGLSVHRYDAAALAAAFAPAFEIVRHSRELHATPAGAVQPFTYVVLQRRHDATSA
ncbi:MAG TPA: methyltransferase domain-containing protein [Rhodanobacteraceae bacterium]|nr:methyltransferase domain-containing protein [Rhodanobacteraceae bacterium]